MMEMKIKKIDQEIEALKNQLNQSEGSETEVYSRIVGYYRSVKNWNHGKKEEYKTRIPFSNTGSTIPGGKNNEIQNTENKNSDRKKDIDSPGKVCTFSFYYKSSCPNCPPMKEVLKKLSIEGDHLNVDMNRGMESAQENMVFSAPTVIFRDAGGKELFRTSYPSEVLDFFNLDSVSA